MARWGEQEAGTQLHDDVLFLIYDLSLVSERLAISSTCHRLRRQLASEIRQAAKYASHFHAWCDRARSNRLVRYLNEYITHIMQRTSSQ